MSTESDDQAPEGKSPLLSKLLISGFVTAVVIGESFIFFFLVPSADDVAALAEARLVEQVEAKMEKDGEEKIESAETVKEFSLGEYGVVFIPPGSDRTYRVEFRLFGTIHAKDEKRLEALFNERQGRFRHRMMLEVRTATMDELTENQLGLIQRRILATSNEILEEPILLGIGFDDYQLLEE